MTVIGSLFLVLFLLIICASMSALVRFLSALPSVLNILIGLGLVVAALWMGNESFTTSILVGHQSKSWPTTEIRPMRIHTLNFTPLRGDIHQQSEIVYEYLVDGKPYRSELFDVHGDLRRSRDPNLFFSKERFAASRAHFDPESPGLAVLQPGIVFDQRSNFYAALLCIGLAQLGFGVLTLGDPKLRRAEVAESFLRRNFHVRQLSAVVLAGFIIAGLVFGLRWITASELSGKPKDAAYRVVQEETYPGGLRYKVSVYRTSSASRMESVIPSWLERDYLDSEYRGNDGGLHPITERTWLFYKSGRHLQIEEIEEGRMPDFALRWRASEGVTLIEPGDL